MSEIALGTKVFSRTNELRGLLESIPDSDIATVYIADDGPNKGERKDLYEANWPFELNIIDMKYDAGLGAGRKQIVETMDETFLLLVDTDHRVPPNISQLREILDEKTSLGGVGGMMYEPHKSLLYCGTQNFKEEDGVLIVSPYLGPKEIQIVAGSPFIQFDSIPNAALFRRECVEDYCWDPEYVIGKEHEDFYLGHKRQTDWEFGISFSVYFQHTSASRMAPESEDEYDQHRYDIEKLNRSTEYFLDKWGLEEVQVESWTWFVLDSRNLPKAIAGEIL